jgi:5-methylcytosine-specific restriction endonuclease McrA
MDVAWDQVIGEIEDILAPQLHLDSWEHVVYYHLLRHTRLKGLPSGHFAVGALSKSLPLSDFKVREVLRSLHAKGCVRIEDRSRIGHLVSVFLPSEIQGLRRQSEEDATIDLASLDFFTGRRYVRALLARENNSCFYCLKAITVETCELDHLVPQAEKIDHSFRNVVASCHNCNKTKGSSSASDFVRQRYRSGVLSEEDLQNRLAALEAVQSGTLIPDVRGISS